MLLILMPPILMPECLAVWT